MTTLAANRPAYDGKALDLTGKSGARAFKNTLATVLIILCFLVAALNREHGGRMQEQIGLLDRMREKLSP